MGNSKAFMLPGAPLLPSILPFRFVPRNKIHFPIAVWLWQSNGKVKKISLIFSGQTRYED
jgi:hypothetical protein